MDPSTVLLLVAVLACPIMMGGMMWWMSRNMSDSHDQGTPERQQPSDAAERLAALKQQRQALEAEIAEVARIAELETEREQLAHGQVQPGNEGNGATALR